MKDLMMGAQQVRWAGDSNDKIPVFGDLGSPTPRRFAITSQPIRLSLEILETNL